MPCKDEPAHGAYFKEEYMKELRAIQNTTIVDLKYEIIDSGRRIIAAFSEKTMRDMTLKMLNSEFKYYAEYEQNECPC